MSTENYQCESSKGLLLHRLIKTFRSLWNGWQVDCVKEKQLGAVNRMFTHAFCGCSVPDLAFLGLCILSVKWERMPVALPWISWPWMLRAFVATHLTLNISYMIPTLVYQCALFAYMCALYSSLGLKPLRARPRLCPSITLRHARHRIGFLAEWGAHQREHFPFAP